MNNQPNPNSNPSLKAHKPHPTSKTPNQPLFAQSVPNNMVSGVPMLSNPRYPNTGLYPPVYVPTPPDYGFRQMYPGPNMSQPTANDSFTYNDDEPLDEKKQPTVAPKDTNNQEQPKNLEDIIELSMKIKKKTLYSSSFNEQTLPFLVSLKAGTLKNDAKVPIDLICVIDHSGSMSGEKIELVKNTFNFLLEYMDSSDRLSIVIFDNQASRIVPLLRTTPENKIKVLAALKDVHGRGGTDINLGITHACQILKQRRYNNPVSSIFLLSDGLDGGAQNKIKATLTQLKIPEDITINTFGYGRDHDPQLMTDIANLRDGGFYFIDKLDQVDEAFVDCWGGLISGVPIPKKL